MEGIANSALSDITNSPAYAHLDKLSANGQLSEAQVTLYKSKYAHLHEVVLNTYESEKALLAKARLLNDDLVERKLKLEKRAGQAADEATSIEELRSTLEAKNVGVSELEEQSAMMKYEIEELQRHQSEIDDDLNVRRAENERMIEPTLIQLRDNIDEVKDEIERQKDADKAEMNMKEEYRARLESLKSTIEQLEKTKMQKRQDLNRARLGPERVKAQIDVARKASEGLERQAAHLQEEIDRLNVEIEQVLAEKRKTSAAQLELAYNLDNIRADTWKSERAVSDIRRNLEQEKLRNAEAVEAKLGLELKRQALRLEMRHAHDALVRLGRQIDEQKRHYERLRRKTDAVVSSIEPIRQHVANAGYKLDVVVEQHKQDQNSLQQLTQDVDILISQYLKEEKCDVTALEKLKEYEEINANLEDGIRQSVRQERELRSMIRELSGKREMMARDSSKATALFLQTKEDLKVKELVLLDLNKKLTELKGRLSQCSALYDVVKNQRNKYANLTQASAQELAEMKEKIKILHNEVEILRSESAAKDKSLADEARVLQTAQSTRDAFRLEMSKAQMRALELKDDSARQLMEVEQLNSIINAAEKEMIRLRKDYARAVEGRNRTGIQLIDRNDELCILHEKSNIFEGLLQRGQRQLGEYAERMRRLNIEVSELQWRIRNANLNAPSAEQYEALEARLVESESALQAERKRITELSEILESPSLRSKKGRKRNLGGEDPDKAQLSSKIEALQELLNDKKEQLLEKELVLEEVGTLSDKLRTQAAEGHDETLELAKSMNEYQANIRSITRKMMATVSELSMYQATAMNLEQEKCEKENELKQSRELLDQGLPPSDDAEHEWYRMERDRLRREQELLDGAAAADQSGAGGVQPQPQQARPGTLRTTAEPRPNAYIPDELGIPRPYGANAPFKPTVPGSNMRHMHRPVIAEIII